jgi:hypothetical protein
VDKHTGQVKRAKHWLSRYRNMNSHTHNNLRISTRTYPFHSLPHAGESLTPCFVAAVVVVGLCSARILTSLGHLGFARWKKPLVDFFTVQILEKGHLRACRNALLNYWYYGHTRPGECPR